MTELLMLIALWCGQPMNKEISFNSYGSVIKEVGDSRTKWAVYECRNRILRCQNKLKKTKAVQECFTADGSGAY